MAEVMKPGSGSAQVTVSDLRRLGKNAGAYRGETIDIHSVLEECRSAADKYGWISETVQAARHLSFPTFFRRAGKRDAGTVAVYISAGIHGDEPAGPVAVKQMLQHNAWPANLDLWVCPCLNPTGFVENRRENASGTDLNRQYLQPQAEEIVAHIAWLERQPWFDLCLCLHEDWEAHGFYVYELNPDGRTSLAEAMVQQVALVCPVDTSDIIEGRKAIGGIIRPGAEHLTRKQWPEAFFLLMHKTRLSYTLEAPSDYPLHARVGALVTGVNSALEGISKATALTRECRREVQGVDALGVDA
jgi:hypothetical protein